MPVETSSLFDESRWFVDREAELHDLRDYFAGSARSEPPFTPIALIVGESGQGKTALAMTVAHDLATSYPDGILSISTHESIGRHGGSVVQALLNRLPGYASSLPYHPTHAQLMAAWNQALHNRQFLIMVDDVETSPEIVELLAPTPTTCGVILTSRVVIPLPLTALTVQLGRLPNDAIIEFLERRGLPADRRAGLADLTNLLETPRQLAQLVSALPTLDVAGAKDSLDRAAIIGDSRDRWVLQQAYNALSSEDKRLFRMLGALVQPVFQIDLIAAVAELDVARATNRIDRLVERQLISKVSTNLYQLAEPTQLFAKDVFETEESDSVQQSARERVFRWAAIATQYQPEPQIAADRWTADDRLGYAQYADAIVAFVRHRETAPPLTIGIKAMWGAGKTSLMRMVQERLDPRADRQSWEPTTLRLVRDAGDRPLSPVREDDSVKNPIGRRLRRFGNPSQGTIRDSGSSRHISNLDLLRRSASEDPSEADSQYLRGLGVEPPTDPTLPTSGDWRPTVWFNPWMYQSGEQVWAGLAYEIISQVTDRLEPADRERFWLELNLRRVRPDAIRRRIYRALATRYVPALLGTLFALVPAVIAAILNATLSNAWVASFTKGVAAAAISLGGGLSLVAIGVQTMGFLRARAATTFGDLLRQPREPGDSALGAVGTETGASESPLLDPGYESRLGFLYLVQTDMGRVLDLIASRHVPLVVFIDDLDRCSASVVAQVIEAINLFLAGPFPNCVFIAAMEPAVVAAHVEATYKDLVAKLDQQRLPGEWSTLGWRFLGKIVQLPLTIPVPEDRRVMMSYIDSLLMPGEPVAHVPPMDLRSVQNTEAARERPVRANRGKARQDASAAGVITESSAPSGLVGDPERDRRALLVPAIEAAIRRRHPSVATLPTVTREAQDEVLGQHAEELTAEALEAANRVFVELYSDSDSRAAIVYWTPWLGSINPREIKRFVNLFRFFSFIVQQYRLRAVVVPSGYQLGKLAILAVRWPQLLHLLSSAVSSEEGRILAYLERSARSTVNHSSLSPDRGDVLDKDNDIVQSDGWRAALVRVGLVDESSDGDHQTRLGQFEPLRDFLATEPSIVAAATLLL